LSQVVERFARVKHHGHKNNQWKCFGTLIYCLAISLLFLLICTKSSPLYPFNDWVDANAYFTVGKGMMNGLIPYRDLFEQKGPLLFLIHGLAYLISNTTFLGVFVFEVVAFTVFLYYCHKIILLFFDIKHSVVGLPLIAAIVLNMKAFSYGDSAEEWCIPLITISLFHILNYVKNKYPQPIDNRLIFVIGFWAGCVLWIKFTLLGFWIGWVLSISILLLINKEYLCVIKSWISFLSGMFLATLPWLVYFGINNSIMDWLETYFYINMVYYSASKSLLERLVGVATEIAIGFGLNYLFGIVFIIGALFFMRKNDLIDHRLSRIGLLPCILFTILGTYGGGTGYIYYFLIFAPFLVLGIITIGWLLTTKYNDLLTFRSSAAVALFIILAAWPLTIKFNHNADLLGADKKELFQYQMADVINEDGGTTLLNYGTLDIGLYTVTNITPNVRFFYKPNISYSRFPLIMDEQNRYIKERAVDYVVMVKPASQDSNEMNVPGLYDKYEMIMEHHTEINMNKYGLSNDYTQVKYLLFRAL